VLCTRAEIEYTWSVYISKMGACCSSPSAYTTPPAPKWLPSVGAVYRVARDGCILHDEVVRVIHIDDRGYAIYATVTQMPEVIPTDKDKNVRRYQISVDRLKSMPNYDEKLQVVRVQGAFCDALINDLWQKVVIVHVNSSSMLVRTAQDSIYWIGTRGAIEPLGSRAGTKDAVVHLEPTEAKRVEAITLDTLPSNLVDIKFPNKPVPAPAEPTAPPPPYETVTISDARQVSGCSA
jgi:hypothetical protein